MLNRPSLRLLNLFSWLDSYLFDHKKMDKKSLDKFLYCVFCYHIVIKDFLPKQATFYEYTRKIGIYIIITSKKRSSLDIYLKRLNQNTSSKDIILIT